MYEIRLAPMCGITDHIYRTLCYEQGCDLAYTEMISAMGYLCAPEQRATKELMIRGANEPKLIIQLFGRDPDIVAEAAKRICDLEQFDGIDINMGCPAKKIAPSGEGCGLMRTPDIAEKMMKMAVKASTVPISVKMRLGYDSEHINVIDFAKMAEDSGVASITVHGRTKEQQYSGKADWGMIEKVKNCVHIPVIGNGDIFSAEEAISVKNKYHTDGIMIGRGAMGNPWLFREIKMALSGHEIQPISYEQKMEMILRHYKMMLDSKPEHIAVREMRKHIGWYSKGIKDAGKFRADINRCVNASEAMNMIKFFFESAASERASTEVNEA